LEGAPEPAGEFLGPWMRIAEPAKRKAFMCEPAERQAACEREAVKVSLDNLATFPWIAERVTAGRLRLHGAIFDIRSGVLSILRADGVFAAA
jgi:carbonic anhydrase